MLGIASSLAVVFVTAALPSDGVPQSTCPITEPEIHATGLEFSAPGCWEISASAGGEEIRFVTWVRPGGIVPEYRLARRGDPRAR